MKYNNFTYATISIDDLPKVNFQEILQTSHETVRRSLDFTKFIISWKKIPSFIEDESVVPITICAHREAVEIMRTEEWTPKESEDE